VKRGHNGRDETNQCTIHVYMKMYSGGEEGIRKG
jgi:hypothetical protein